MNKEQALEQVKNLARTLDDLITDVRGLTYVDLQALSLAQMQAQMFLMAIASAIQGITHDGE